MRDKHFIESNYNINDIHSIVSNFECCKDPIELYPLSFLQSRYEKKYITSQSQFIELMNSKKILTAKSEKAAFHTDEGV